MGDDTASGFCTEGVTRSRGGVYDFPFPIQLYWRVERGMELVPPDLKGPEWITRWERMLTATGQYEREESSKELFER